MLWQELTSTQHTEVRRDTPVILPIGSTEQHGPALPVCVDTLIASELCRALEQKNREGVLLLEPLGTGYSEHHMSFPGSLSLSHETMISYICDIGACLVRQGYTKLLIFNGHGGNQALMQVCIEKLGNRYPKLNIMGGSWWKLCQSELQALQESGFMGNGHAAEFEFSLLEYLRPELVDYAHKSKTGKKPNLPLPQARGDLVQGGPVSLLRNFAEMTDDGTFGLTDKASREKGEKIFCAALAALEALLADIAKLPDR